MDKMWNFWNKGGARVLVIWTQYWNRQYNIPFLRIKPRCQDCEHWSSQYISPIETAKHMPFGLSVASKQGLVCSLLLNIALRSGTKYRYCFETSLSCKEAFEKHMHIFAYSFGTSIPKASGFSQICWQWVCRAREWNWRAGVQIWHYPCRPAKIYSSNNWGNLMAVSKLSS